MSIAGICLIQAARSFLHFSQLSAWLNKSSGSRPQQLLYRVTMPGQAFASKFASKPVEHHFPLAHVGRLATHAIKVKTTIPIVSNQATKRKKKPHSQKVGGQFYKKT